MIKLLDQTASSKSIGVLVKGSYIALSDVEDEEEMEEKSVVSVATVSVAL